MKMNQTLPISGEIKTVASKHIAMTQVINCAGESKIINKGKINNEILLQGKLVNLKLPSGILLFGGRTIEQDSRTVLGRAGQSLSICVVLAGSLSFSYGDRSFELISQQGNSHAVAVRLKHGIPFTRTLKLNQYIKKLHIVLTPEWFERQGSALKSLPLAQLQAHLNAVYWHPSLDITRNINKFLDTTVTDWTQAFQAERLVSLILQDMLEGLTVNTQTTGQGSGINAESSHENKKHNSTIGLVVNYLEENLHRDIKLNELADVQAMSVSSLQRKFKAEFGITIALYIKERRLEHVMAGIRSCNIKCVAEAAYQAKYLHNSNFVTAFKKKFSITPGELIQQYQS